MIISFWQSRRFFLMRITIQLWSIISSRFLHFVTEKLQEIDRYIHFLSRDKSAGANFERVMKDLFCERD